VCALSKPTKARELRESGTWLASSRGAHNDTREKAEQEDCRLVFLYHRCSGQRACRTARVCRKWCGTCSQWLAADPKSGLTSSDHFSLLLLRPTPLPSRPTHRDLEYLGHDSCEMDPVGDGVASATSTAAPPLPKLRPLSSPARLESFLNAVEASPRSRTRSIAHLATFIAPNTARSRMSMRLASYLRSLALEWA
jgi:hypothetical protein